jgi:hypothetical protein
MLIVFSTLVFASEVINVKDYIKGKFPVIFNIYLASLGDLDEYEKEFIDLLQILPEEEQKNFAKEIHSNGFSNEILEKIKKEGSVTEPKTEIEEQEIGQSSEIDEDNTGKWFYSKEIDPLSDKVIITFTLECEKDELLNEPIFLIIKKEGKETIIYIDWNRELKPLYGTLVTVYTRFGDNKPSQSAWETTNTLQLKSRDKMTLTAVFDIRGLKNAVEQFNDILHWIK